MLVILMSMATIRVSAQAFKFSGGLREMLSAAHVAGIAAGLGTANVPYRGIAPESDIVYQ